MRFIRLFIIVLASVLISTGIIDARVVGNWSYQELLDKSDLTVIATPTATGDTKERIHLPGSTNVVGLVGVETRFTVFAVLKGDKALKDLVLHHYRAGEVILPNSHSFVSFEVPKNPVINAVREAAPVQRTYILFLVLEADGRYAPVVGLADPGLAIKELTDTGK